MQQRDRAGPAKPSWASVTLWLRPVAPARVPEKPPERPRETAQAQPPPAPATPISIPPVHSQQDLTPSEAGTPAPATTSSSEATAGSAAGAAAVAPDRTPLRIELPKPGKAGEFTKFHNPALSDPRSNTRIRLTLEEKMAIALGSVECILEERQPDGSVWRGAGRKLTMAPAIAATGAAAAGSDPKANVSLCVR